MTAPVATAPLRVLIVEDHEDDADLVVRELNRAGLPARPRRIMTAAELRAALSESEWDLVLADYQLPQFSAPAALRLLKSTGHDLPFIVVSGTVGEDTAVEVLRAGAHDFMIKGKLARLGPVVQRELREAQVRAERRKMEERLHVSEVHLRMLVNGVHDHAMIMLDRDGCIITWNPAAERIFGYSAEHIAGREYDCLYTPEDLAKAAPWRTLEVAAIAERIDVEGWRVRQDGSRFWADSVISAVRDKGGELVGFSEVTRDGTARRRADDERAASLAREQAARAEAETAVRMRDEFLAIASHELRTPLTVLRATAQLILRWQQHGTLDQKRLERALTDLDRSAARLAHLTDDLLDVGRLRDGRLSLRATTFDFAELLAAMVEQVRLRIGSAHSIDLVRPSGACPFTGDHARIEQVLTNLLENAVKYSPEGGAIRVLLRAPKHGYELRVADRGIGLPDGANELIFEPFGRAANSTARGLPGMGLGLYICRQIVEAHGGRIWAESKGENRGTSMCVSLPGSPD